MANLQWVLFQLFCFVFFNLCSFEYNKPGDDDVLAIETCFQ